MPALFCEAATGAMAVTTVQSIALIHESAVREEAVLLKVSAFKVLLDAHREKQFRLTCARPEAKNTRPAAFRAGQPTARRERTSSGWNVAAARS